MSASTLVIGASSPLGLTVVDELRRHGREVAAASRGGDIHLDVLDRESVSAAFVTSRPQEVVYLVSPTRVEDREHLPRHVGALRRVADAAAAYGVKRFLFASSAAVYGPDSEVSLTEQAPLAGSTPYAQLKVESEAALRDLEQTSMAITIARIFNVWGEGFDRSLINRLADAVEVPALQLQGDFVRDYIHAVDVARALRLLLDRHEGRATTVNVGTGAATSNVRLTELFDPTSFTIGADGPVSRSVADVALLHSLTGWVPPTLETRLESRSE